ncbi:long-chain fatty acid--CoA ligase [Pontibacillus salipaludis]|uniref:Long-chain-fatty-acid--CoA ligase n=1 Tax=Pontibacillus salipaludis TaxID=1697394 RepID=A0ABQ1Q700_9BACI|nr:long-chain fatty acid--CoA ligase [Pontibacillus salipaludis]GGD15536.1 long-chain-fatty-acid--CoA ligase [Pontibacillus salipaludis]
MFTNHLQYYPNRVTKSLSVPQTTLYHNLEVAAARFPDHPAMLYYGSEISYRTFKEEAGALAGYLQHKLNVEKGEPVLIFMQNSPQYAVSFYGINRADALVVPINPMLTSEELAFFIQDSQIKNAIVGQELYDRVQPLLKSTSLESIVVASYSDYLPAEHMEDLPPEVLAPRQSFHHAGTYYWKDALAAGLSPKPAEAGPDDLCVMPYTSGTTGKPKGCMHTNSTVQANAVSAYNWVSITMDSVHLTTLPLFHVTGMLHSLHAPVYGGCTMVIVTRWDREMAAKMIEENQVTHWVMISTMLIDFLSNPTLSSYDISSLQVLAGGGAALPEAVGNKLYEMTGLKFIEGYGLSETISHTHFNPPDRPKLQCLGVPSFDVDARIIDPATQLELGVNETGEIVVNGPQVFVGYYNESDNEGSFLDIDGKTFFRTGDIGRVDEEGYFFIVDRVKRMINASGYKVWPTEVESLLYNHPSIQQACVVGVPDPRRGETVKAFVILNEEAKGTVAEEEIIEWAKEHMAAYKYPRLVEFRDSLPTTSSGKILWRKLQEEEKSQV